MDIVQRQTTSGKADLGFCPPTFAFSAATSSTVEPDANLESWTDDAFADAGFSPNMTDADQYGPEGGEGSLWTGVADDDRGGLDGHEGAFHLDPQAAVESWRFRALGRRPRDFMARDLLLGSLWRDNRPRVFHTLSKDPVPWLEDHVRNLPGKLRAQAIQLDVLHYLHRRQLACLSQGDYPNWDLEVDGRGMLAKLAGCWPYGALMTPPSRPHENEVRRRRCCGLPWLCPWCYARAAERLYRLLQAGPLQDTQDKYLVLGWFSTYGAQASPDSAWADVWAGRCDTGGYYLQGPRKVRSMRQAVHMKLRQYARELGITGGILTHQISPWRTGDPVYRRGVPSGLPTFRHDYALLGEVTLPTDEEKQRFLDATAYNSSAQGRIELTDPDLIGGNIVLLNWSSHPADDGKTDTLRLFLAGSSLSYPVRKLEACDGRREQVNRVRGAFALQPNFMMDDVQWWSYAETTRGLPLYVPFGSWRSSIHEVKEKQKAQKKMITLPVPARQRKAASARGKALKAANVKRQQGAQDEVARLVAIARPLLQGLMANKAGKRGRPAYRSGLKHLLEANGYSVSMRQLKQVMARLRDDLPAEPSVAEPHSVRKGKAGKVIFGTGRRFGEGDVNRIKTGVCGAKKSFAYN
jgi:hypothetical protein